MSNSGVQGFSTPHNDLVIFEADTQHAAHAVRGLLSASGVWFIPCLGSWEGVTSPSYLMRLDDFARLNLVETICKAQKCIMILGGMDSHSRRKASLQYLDGRPDVDLGRLYSVALQDACKHSGWTIPCHVPAAGEIVAYVTGHVDKFGQIISA